MKALNVLLIILFVLSAALQYNDPDPYIWMPIYLYGALLCYLAIKQRYVVSLFVAGLILYSGYALYLFFADNGVLDWVLNHDSESIVQSMEPKKPWIEETREFFGLLILIASIVINMIWLSIKTRNNGLNDQQFTI